MRPVAPARREYPTLLLVPSLSIGLAGGVVWFIHQIFFVLGVHPWPLWVETACGAACAYLLSAAISLGLRWLTWRDTQQSQEDEIQGAASTALWCAPTAILAAHSSPVAFVAGVILLVSATRLMFFRWEAAAKAPPAAPRSGGGNLFIFESPLTRAGIPGLPILTAIAAEASLFMFVIGRSYSGVSVAGLGIVLSVLIVSRQTRRPHREAAARMRLAALSILVAVALGFAGQLLPFQKKYGKAPATPGNAQEHLSASNLYGLGARADPLAAVETRFLLQTSEVPRADILALYCGPKSGLSCCSSRRCRPERGA